MAIKHNCTLETIVDFTSIPSPAVEDVLQRSLQTGRLTQSGDTFILTALARVALSGRYSFYYQDLRTDRAFTRAYEQFEHINIVLKQIVTDWQTISIQGDRFANRHDDKDYDDRIIERLGNLHDKVSPILSAFTKTISRFSSYETKLLRALELIESGDLAWFSDIRRESYHTIWFEMHEDILRVMGRERQE